MIASQWLTKTPHLSDFRGTGFPLPTDSNSGPIVERSLHGLQRARENQSLREAKHAGAERRAVVDRLREHYQTYRMPHLLRAHREPFQL